MNGKIELVLYQDGRAPVAVASTVPQTIENSYGPMSIASAIRGTVEDLTRRLADKVYEGRKWRCLGFKN